MGEALSPPYSRTIVPVFLTEAKRPRTNGAGDLVQHSRTMRIPLKLSFRGLCGEYSVKPLNRKLLYISGKVKNNMDSRLTMESPESRFFSSLECLTMKIKDQSKINA
jgi:hypothetical protein